MYSRDAIRFLGQLSTMLFKDSFPNNHFFVDVNNFFDDMRMDDNLNL
jgi:hypothetical protein